MSPDLSARAVARYHVPSFIEPEVALRAAGFPVHHVVLQPPDLLVLRSLTKTSSLEAVRRRCGPRAARGEAGRSGAVR